MTIVVIGATGTIGHAVADALAARHNVVRASRSGPQRVDIEDAASVAALLDHIEPIDGVVVCAPSVRTAMMARAPVEQLTERHVDVALRRLMTQVQLVLAAIPRVSDGGSITLTTGQLATRPMPGASALTMAGAGLEGFIRAAALDMPRQVRLNGVSPGWIKETMEHVGMESTRGLPAKRLADFYLMAVEGSMTGTIIDPTA